MTSSPTEVICATTKSPSDNTAAASGVVVVTDTDADVSVTFLFDNVNCGLLIDHSRPVIPVPVTSTIVPIPVSITASSIGSPSENELPILIRVNGLGAVTLNVAVNTCLPFRVIVNVPFEDTLYVNSVSVCVMGDQLTPFICTSIVCAVRFVPLIASVPYSVAVVPVAIGVSLRVTDVINPPCVVELLTAVP